MDVAKVVIYRTTLADEKWQTATALLEKKRFADCLFFCHLTVECLLKAMVAKNTEEQAKPIHHLVRLSEIAGIDLSPEKRELLKEISDFNMETRYPEEKLAFFKKANEAFTRHFVSKTEDLVVWLKKLLKNKQ